MNKQGPELCLQHPPNDLFFIRSESALGFKFSLTTLPGNQHPSSRLFSIRTDSTSGLKVPIVRLPGSLRITWLKRIYAEDTKTLQNPKSKTPNHRKSLLVRHVVDEKANSRRHLNAFVVGWWESNPPTRCLKRPPRHSTCGQHSSHNPCHDNPILIYKIVPH